MLRILRKSACVFFICLASAGCASRSGSVKPPELEYQAPIISEEVGISGSVPLIDGTIEEGEWQDAEIWEFSGGGKLYLLTTSDDLYLAVRALPKGMIVGNVFMYRGDEIIILHSSAALGTAVYQREGDHWKKTRDFEWCCRSRIDDQISREARLTFSEKEGWLGANSFLGAENELEYKILLEGMESAIAVNFLWADDSVAKQVWPEGLTDGVSWPVQGGFPEEMEFTTWDWYKLSFPN